MSRAMLFNHGKSKFVLKNTPAGLLMEPRYSLSPWMVNLKKYWCQNFYSELYTFNRRNNKCKMLQWHMAGKDNAETLGQEAGLIATP